MSNVDDKAQVAAHAVTPTAVSCDVRNAADPLTQPSAILVEDAKAVKLSATSGPDVHPTVSVADVQTSKTNTIRVSFAPVDVVIPTKAPIGSASPIDPRCIVVPLERHALALFDFDAVATDQLSFKAGAVISVAAARPDQVWWYGKCNDKVGFFLQSHVAMYDSVTQRFKLPGGTVGSTVTTTRDDSKSKMPESPSAIVALQKEVAQLWTRVNQMQSTHVMERETWQKLNQYWDRRCQGQDETIAKQKKRIRALKLTK